MLHVLIRCINTKTITKKHSQRDHRGSHNNQKMVKVIINVFADGNENPSAIEKETDCSVKGLQRFHDDKENRHAGKSSSSP